MSSGLALGLIVLGFLVLASLIYGSAYLQPVERPSLSYRGPPAPPAQPPIHIQVHSESGDDRYTRAPKPERDWLARPDLSMLWNAPTAGLPSVATRGLPEAYQSMGVLKTEGGQVLPLYGRRTASRSDRFQYYTRTDTYNPVQLPIQYKRRDCQDDVGCDELMDGEVITVTPTGQTATATLYRFSGPTYLPTVF